MQWKMVLLKKELLAVVYLKNIFFIFKGEYAIYFFIVCLNVCMFKLLFVSSHCFHISILGTFVWAHSEKMKKKLLQHSCSFVIERIALDNMVINWITMQPTTVFGCMTTYLLFTCFLLCSFTGLWVFVVLSAIYYRRERGNPVTLVSSSDCFPITINVH